MNIFTNFALRFAFCTSFCLIAAFGIGCNDEDETETQGTTNGNNEEDSETEDEGDSETEDEGSSLPQDADVDRLTDVLETLSNDAMGGRLTGTESGDMAEQYIIDYLTDVGFEPETQDVDAVARCAPAPNRRPRAPRFAFTIRKKHWLIVSNSEIS